MSTADRSGRTYRFGKNLEFYAYHGAIRCHVVNPVKKPITQTITDAITGQPVTIAIGETEQMEARVVDRDPATFLKHATQLYREIARIEYRDQKATLRKMASEVEDACNEARRQGRPYETTEAEKRAAAAFAIEHAKMLKAKNRALGLELERRAGYSRTDGGILVPSPFAKKE